MRWRDSSGLLRYFDEFARHVATELLPISTCHGAFVVEVGCNDGVRWPPRAISALERPGLGQLLRSVHEMVGGNGVDW